MPFHQKAKHIYQLCLSWLIFTIWKGLTDVAREKLLLASKIPAMTHLVIFGLAEIELELCNFNQAIKKNTLSWITVKP